MYNRINISDELKRIRPTLSSGSLKTYTSLLNSVHKNDTRIKKYLKAI